MEDEIQESKKQDDLKLVGFLAMIWHDIEFKFENIIQNLEGIFKVDAFLYF